MARQRSWLCRVITPPRFVSFQFAGRRTEIPLSATTTVCLRNLS